MLTARLVFVVYVYFFAWIPFQSVVLQADEVSATATLSESEKLSSLFESYLDDLQRCHPENATYFGFTDAYNALWTDHSEAGYDSRHRLVEQRLEQLHSIDKSTLSAEEQLNYELLSRNLKVSLKEHEFHVHYMPLDQLGGIPLDVESILMIMPKENENDYDKILSRLSGIPILIDQTIALMKAGVEKGLTKPRVSLRHLPESFSKMISPPVGQSIFFQPFMNLPGSVSPEAAEKMREKALELIGTEVYPAYAKLKEYLEMAYLPACRTTVGTNSLPNGEQYYHFCIEKHTTTSLDASEIHQIGLAEVNRIQREMEEIIKRDGLFGSIKDYMSYLIGAPEFYYQSPEDLIQGYQALTSFIDGELPNLFGRLPKLPYEIVPVPGFAEQGQVTAYYMQGSWQTGRPGRFYVNTYDIGSRPKWQMESLALHEAVPGHHFQLSLAQEIEGLPEFRRNNLYTAYVEGWGLYSESLGAELGLYKTSADQFGRLIEEIWRAVRLVVDTGMHAFNWTRDEAIAYMRETTGLSEREVTTEIDRYIVWPGQALAYKIGELSIQRWRREAKETLGDAFDIRAFHDTLLSQGALPLDLCEKYVSDWISSQAAKNP